MFSGSIDFSHLVIFGASDWMSFVSTGEHDLFFDKNWGLRGTTLCLHHQHSPLALKPNRVQTKKSTSDTIKHRYKYVLLEKSKNNYIVVTTCSLVSFAGVGRCLFWTDPG